MRTVKILIISLVFVLVSCSSVKNDTVNYKLKNDILYYKNDKIGHVSENKSYENDQETEKKYTIVLDDDFSKDLILKQNVINYFIKEFSDDGLEVEVYITSIK